MREHLARAINSVLKSHLKLNVRKGKHGKPCTRIWSRKVYPKQIAAVNEQLKETYLDAWKEAGIWDGHKSTKAVYADYFACADRPGKVESDSDEEQISFITRLLGETSLLRGQNKHQGISKQLNLDKLEGKPDLCSTIAVCTQTETRLGEFPFSPEAKMKDRINLLRDLRNLEIVALIVIQVYRVKTDDMVFMLCFQKNKISAGCAKQLADWMISTEAQQLFPILHGLALEQHFLVLHAVETEKYDL